MTSVEQVALPEVTEAGAPSPRLASRLGPVAVGLALLSAVITFLVLTGLTPVVPTHDVVVGVLLGNAAMMLVLLGIIAYEVFKIVQARRRGRAGAKLHVRIVGLFSVIAAVPAILLAVIASITLERGLDRWFSTRTRAVIENSLTVAEAYLREHAAMIRGDILAMLARTLDGDADVVIAGGPVCPWSRRVTEKARFQSHGHTPGLITPPREEPGGEFPMTLDLRRPIDR